MQWNETRAAFASLRTAYLAEVGKLAEDLRPRLESGELGNSYGDEDSPDGPGDRLELECARRFGIETQRISAWEYEGGDLECAEIILAASPSRDHEDVERGSDFAHLCLAAAAAVALDVLSYANEHGWARRAA